MKFVAMCVLLAGIVVARADKAPVMIVQPTVSRDEAELVGRVVALAETNRAAAIVLLEEARTAKSSAALDFTLGNLHYQAAEYPAAIQAYREALAKLPTFRAARVNLARLYLLGEQPEEALPVLREVATDGQADADTYLLLGHALLLTDALVSAETAYRQALMLRPGDSDALLGLARALLPQDRPRETLALSRELLRRDPMRREWWGLQANAFMALERPEEAARALETARRLDLADAEMLATLGDLHLNARRIEEAADVYTMSMTVTGAPPVARTLRALDVVVQLRQVEAAERLIKVLAASETNLRGEQQRSLLRLRADVALLRDDPDAAMVLFNELLRGDPLDGPTLLRLAGLHREAGRFEDAAITLERAARLPATQVDALVRHAQLEVQRQRYVRARELLESAQALAPRDAVQRYLDQVRRLADLEH